MHPSHRRLAGRLASLLALMLVLTFSAPAQAEDSTRPQGGSPNLGELIEKTGLNFHSLGREGYLVRFQSDSAADVDVLVVYWDESKKHALIFSTLVDREPGEDFSPALLRKAMELNNGHPFAKFVLDPEHGDLDCQTELDLAGLTPEALAWHINWVATVSEKGRDLLKDL